MSLSAPVTVQVREYIDPTIGVATLASTLTVMVGPGSKTKFESQTLLRKNQECSFRIGGSGLRD